MVRFMDWSGLVPMRVARQQHAWERDRYARAAKRHGLTHDEIGQRLNLSRQRVSQMLLEAQPEQSPVESYLQERERHPEWTHDFNFPPERWHFCAMWRRWSVYDRHGKFHGFICPVCHKGKIAKLAMRHEKARNEARTNRVIRR